MVEQKKKPKIKSNLNGLGQEHLQPSPITCLLQPNNTKQKEFCSPPCTFHSRPTAISKIPLR